MKRSAGFTLIEMIVSMVILGIISAGVAIFMTGPINAYDAAKRRAQQTQTAQLAFSRVKRDLRFSLPNSVRVASSGSSQYLEFAGLSGGGRYREASGNGADPAPACPIDSPQEPDNGILDIGAPDTCFKTIGPVDISGISVGNWLVVNNMGDGYPGANFYESGALTGGNKAKITAVSSTATESRFAFESLAFPSGSPGKRFFTVAGPVSYVCDPVAREIRRYWGYAPQASQPTAGIGSLAGVQSAAVLKNVDSCQISYAPASVASRYGLVSILAKMSLPEGDTVSMLAQAHVSNTP